MAYPEAGTSVDLSAIFGPIYWGTRLYLGHAIFGVNSPIPHFGSVVPLDGLTPELSAECLVTTTITLMQLYAVTSPRKTLWSDPIMLITLIIDSALIFFGLAKGFGALTDIIATIAICMVLPSVRGGISRTNSVINTLIHFVICRGGLVTLIQTLLLVMFFAEPTRLYWLAFHVNVMKLYANTFFAMLNGCKRMKQKATDATASFNNCSSNPHACIEGGSVSVHLGSVHDSPFLQNYERAPKVFTPLGVWYE
ncbi:hypothetical protein BU17DRAFT_60168 [Hysterangium stoloniferum]|nr:hypothetical protein BU17DRAFT_60168 [Hysterangium stoloniferum]